MHGKPWTPAEDAALRRMVASRKPHAQIALELNRTVASVTNRCHSIRAVVVRYRPEARSEQVSRILNENPLLTDTELARVVGCSRDTAGRERARLGFRKLTFAESVASSRAIRRAKKLPTKSETRLLALLDAGPTTAPALAERSGFHRVFVYKMLSDLRRKGKAFAEGRLGRGKGSGKGHCGTTWYSLNWWLVENDRFVWFMARKVHGYNPRAELDDIASVIRLAIAKAVPPFRPRGVKFATYAGLPAYQQGVEFCLKQRNRGIHVPQYALTDPTACPPLVSFGDISPNEGDRAYEPPAREDNSPPAFPDFWERVTAALPRPIGELVVARYRDGRQFADIARDLLDGKSKQWAMVLVKRGTEMLRESGVLAEFAPEVVA